MKLLGNKKLVTTLLFRGSLHGWEPYNFHSHCDEKSPTISLFKIKNGDTIGGFTTRQWESSDEFYVDSDSFLFNLSASRVFPNSGEGGIHCYSHTGPLFSNENTIELYARSPFNGDNKCGSAANRPGYCIGMEGGKNMLTNQENGCFTISELEVWQVTFIVIIILSNKLYIQK